MHLDPHWGRDRRKISNVPDSAAAEKASDDMSKCLRCGAGSEWIEGRVPVRSRDDEIAELREEIERLRQQQPAFRWRRREERPDLAKDGDEFVVVDGTNIAVVAIDPENLGGVLLDVPSYNVSEIEWDDVDWWLPLSELEATLPSEKEGE